MWRHACPCFGTLLLMAGHLAAATIMISDSSPQYSLYDWENDCNCVPAPIARFDFTGQPLLRRVEAISITMSMYDGDTAPGDFDYNNAVLLLDGIDTGVLLNGFPDEQLVTVTNGSTVSLNVGCAVAMALADGRLDADMYFYTTSHNVLSLDSGFVATLVLWGEPGPGPCIPEPNTGVLAGLAVGTLAMARWRRRRRAKSWRV